MNNTAVFIPTYKRAKKVLTYKTLRDAQYDGKIYLIVSDDDPQIEDYKKQYPSEVIIFSKEDARPFTDLCDNFENRKLVVFARNYMFKIAKDLNLDYFCVLDDDYDRFSFRRCFGEKLKGFKVLDIGRIIKACFSYLAKAPNLDCFTWCQDGDFIGGTNSFDDIGRKRKIMNGYFFKTDRPIRFMGSINEDLNASVYEGQRGKVFFTINDVSIHQLITQSNAGGLTEAYLDEGTYLKSFYSVIVAPNCVRVSSMGSKDLRIHHKVCWNKCCPKIIREIHKRGSNGVR